MSCSKRTLEQNPVVSNNGDIIAPSPKGSTRKGNKRNTQNNMNVPWANNKKKKTVLDKNIIWVHNDSSADEGTDPERFIKTVVEALTLGEDEILLAVAWTTKEGRLNHMKYPDVLGVDVTYGKNNEKRPQLCVIGKNTRNQNIPILDAFLPSQQQYVFRWLFQDAFPNLLDKLVLLSTQLIMTIFDV